ncbi:hypothetical protein BKA70DRAFT_1181255 [Coprinopsis sp. MPI-PUGE-AT-0042]|nr:hypothetical protein BKA70DRAFT_1181255 [Coprinopsis sp. MPI-PUGE-AT-0042]
MLQDYPSPIRTFMSTTMPNDTLTLASLNARLSESPTLNTQLLYSRPWGNDGTLDLAAGNTTTTMIKEFDFQSNSRFNKTPNASNENTIPAQTLSGLGIHYPDEFRLSYSPKAFGSDRSDQYLSISPRLESNYSLNDTSLTSFDDLADVSQNLGAMWSIPSFSNDPLDALLQPLPELTVNSSVASTSSNEDLSIESLSAAAGLSVEEFTAKITEGAQHALRHLAEMESLSDGNTSTSNEPSTSSGQDLVFDGIPTLDSLAPFGAMSSMASPDIWFQPCIGINPADIMPAPPPVMDNLDDIFSAVDSGPPVDLEDNLANFTLPPPAIYHPDGSLGLHMSGIAAPTRSALNRIDPPSSLRPHKEEADQMSDYEPPPFLSPSSSEYSPSFGSTSRFQTRSTRAKKRKAVPIEPVEHATPVASTSSEPNTHLPPIDLGSPVFDAHRGIDLEDLKARAERYRLRNHGREYDKRWLLSFAGKLSNKGELIEEFRCYVVGCQQVNKRRDHILIHVGAHLDQRPFKCAHCSARFLRKNECKRHELSHTGVRPFTCHICPFPGTTFVRQDLLRRHMKRTHHMEDDKENKPSTSASGSSFKPRKKAKSY